MLNVIWDIWEKLVSLIWKSNILKHNLKDETWVYKLIFHLINNCWCILPICKSLKKKGLGYSHPPTTIKPPVSKFDIWLIYSKVTCDCVIFNIKFSTTKFSSLTLPIYSRYNWIFEYFVNLWVEISEMVVMRGWVWHF